MGAPKNRSKIQVSFKLTMDLPPGVNMKDAQQYVREAVSAWKGGMNIDEPITKLDVDSIRVALLARNVTY